MAYIFNEGCDEVAFSLTISKHLTKGTGITTYNKPFHQQSRTYHIVNNLYSTMQVYIWPSQEPV